jgi:hypothetical protein
MDKLLKAAVSAFNEIPNTTLTGNLEGFECTDDIASAIDKHLTSNTETKKPVSDEQREKDIQVLCKAILSMGVNWRDNPNGAYENTCPLCHEQVDSGNMQHVPMDEIAHSQECAYLIAKDLLTGIK